MSKLYATVTGVTSHEMLTIVTFDFYGQSLQMLSLDMQQKLHEGQRVVLGVKPWTIGLLGMRAEESTFVNQLHVKVQKIEKGSLLTSVLLSAGESRFESVTIADNSLIPKLHEGDDVVAVIPAGEISVTEICDG